MTDHPLTLEQQRDALLVEVGRTFTQSSADRLALAARAEALCITYEREGGTGTQRWFCTSGVNKGTYYDLRGAGKAQEADITPAPDRPDRAYTDLVEAWRMVERKLEEGLPLDQAVEIAQQAVTTGTVGLRNRNAKRGLEGLAEVQVPDTLAPLLREQAKRISDLARQHGHPDAPSTGPEQLGMLAQAAQAIGDDVWAALLEAFAQVEGQEV